MTYDLIHATIICSIVAVAVFWLGFAKDMRRSIVDNTNATVVIDLQTSSGSGVLLDSMHVLTAFHVPTENLKSELHVFSKNNGVAIGKITAGSYDRDLAVLTLDQPINARPVRINCDAPAVGDPVYAIGEPEAFRWMIRWGHVVDPENPVDRNGAFKLPSDYIKEQYLYTLDINAMHGSSGGGTFADNGDLIGIMSTMWLQQFADKNGEVRQMYMQFGFPVRGDVICGFLNENKVAYHRY